MKKVVLKLELYDEKAKKKAMKIVSAISGVDSIAMDMKDKKLTVTGDVDPVNLVAKLRKLCPTEILTVGPAKEPEKKKEESKKEESKKTDDKKKDSKDDVKAFNQFPFYQNPYYQQPYYQHLQPNYVREEEPSTCVIC